MYKKHKIGVVVPAFNEEKLIEQTILQVPDYIDKIVVVDDASKDKTSKILSKLKNRNELSIIQHKENQGVGSSIMDGYLKLIDDNLDIAVVMAGDNQMDPKYLPKLLDSLIENNFDVAKGNRYLNTKELKSMPSYRFFGNIVITFFTKLASGYWSIFDTLNGYVASRMSVLKLIEFNKIKKRYDFEISMLINLNILGAKIVDVPIPAVYGTEVSDLKVWRVLPGLMKTLFFGFWRRIFYKYIFYNTHPISIFLIFGLLFQLIGFLIGIWSIVATKGHPTASSALLAVLPFLLGFQLALTAIIIDIQNEPK
jgi:glycosyltransferase involved in cell wall biosynthesis